MRWERLFADLESRFDDLEDAQAAAEQADRDRVAVGSVSWAQRLAGSIDHPLRLRVVGGRTVAGQLRRVGPDWLMVQDAGAADTLIASRWITGIDGLTAATGVSPTGVAARLDLRWALRGLARNRSAVAVTTVGAQWSAGGADGSLASGEMTGTVDRVGADFVEIAAHAAWELRRASEVRTVVLVPLPAIVLVRAVALG